MIRRDSIGVESSCWYGPFWELPCWLQGKVSERESDGNAILGWLCCQWRYLGRGWGGLEQFWGQLVGGELRSGGKKYVGVGAVVGPAFFGDVVTGCSSEPAGTPAVTSWRVIAVRLFGDVGHWFVVGCRHGAADGWALLGLVSGLG